MVYEQTQRWKKERGGCFEARGHSLQLLLLALAELADLPRPRFGCIPCMSSPPAPTAASPTPSTSRSNPHPSIRQKPRLKKRSACPLTPIPSTSKRIDSYCVFRSHSRRREKNPILSNNSASDGLVSLAELCQDDATALLPVIRNVPAAGTTLYDRDEDILALYHEGLVMFRTRGRRALPVDAFAADGKDALRSVPARGRCSWVPYVDVARIEVSEPLTFGHPFRSPREKGRQIRVHTKTGAVGDIFLPEPDAEGVLIALRALVGDKVEEGVKVLRFSNWSWFLVALPLLLSLVALLLCGFYELQESYSPLVLMAFGVGGTLACWAGARCRHAYPALLRMKWLLFVSAALAAVGLRSYLLGKGQSLLLGLPLGWLVAAWACLRAGAARACLRPLPFFKPRLLARPGSPLLRWVLPAFVLLIVSGFYVPARMQSEALERVYREAKELDARESRAWDAEHPGEYHSSIGHSLEASQKLDHDPMWVWGDRLGWWTLRACGAAVLWLLFLAARAMGNGDSQTRARERAHRARARHDGVDRSRQRPWRSLPLSLLFKVMGFAALLGAGWTGNWMMQHLEWGSANLVLKVAAFLPSVLLLYSGYRLGLRSAEDVQAEDARPPALYLRPFDHDGRTNFNPSGLAAEVLGLHSLRALRWLGPLGNLNPVRLLRLLFSRADDHSEEQLASFFHHRGPFVAIGRPGEKLALGGASRFYVGNEDWQATVQRIMGEAHTVVLQPGETSHVWWEIEQVFIHSRPARILFDLSCLAGQQWRYERFRLRLEKITGTALPRGLGSGLFLCFQETGPRMLPAVYRSPLVWPIAGCAVNFQRTLAPFLAAQEGRSAPIAAPVSPGRVRFGTAFAAAAWFCLLTWGGLQLSYLFTYGTERWQASGLMEIWRRNKTTRPIAGESLPWKMELPAVWHEVASAAGTPAGAHSYQFGELAEFQVLGVSQESFVRDHHGPAPSAEEQVNLLLGQIRKLDPEARLLKQTKVNSDGRLWLHTELAFRTNGGEEAERQAASHGVSFLGARDYEIIHRCFVDDQAVMVMSVRFPANLQHTLDPLVRTTLAAFKMPTPQEINEEQHRHELNDARALLRERGTVVPHQDSFDSRGLGFRFRMPEAWTESSHEFAMVRRFHLGKAAELLIDLRASPDYQPFTPAGAAKDLVSYLEDSGDSTVRILQQTDATHGGRRWHEMRFTLIQPRLHGSPAEGIARVVPCLGGSFIAVATWDHATGGTLETGIVSVLDSLEVITPAETDAAAVNAFLRNKNISTFTGPNLPYSVTLPGTWEKAKAAEGVELALTLDDLHFTFEVMTFPHQKVATLQTDRASLLAFAGRLEKNFAGTFSDFSVQSHDVITKDGRTWLRICFQGRESKDLLHQTKWIAVTPAGLYYFTFISTLSEQQFHDRAAESVFAGIHLPH